MAPSSIAPASANSSDEKKLDSWKEIAAYLKRDITTVQRWEKREGMPVHRHLHDKRGSVYAFGTELDTWLQRRITLPEPPESGIQGISNNVLAPFSESKRARKKKLVIVGIAVCLALAITYFAVRNRIASRPKIQSLAVLPMKNLSGDSSQEYLADGMTEELIGRLSRVHNLRVISRTSVIRFKDGRSTVPEIAKVLGVDAIVEGSVMREGNRVRVHAQLIRTATDEHFWSETYDRDLGDTLALESEVAESIASKVQATITGEEHARLVAARHVAPEVYESYLKGQYSKGNSRAELEEGVHYFEDAIRRDPTFAPAYLGLGEAYAEMASVFVGAPPEELREKAVSAAGKALELDPELAGAHVLLAGIDEERWRWAESEAEYKRALELSPNDAAAHLGFAHWLLCQGSLEESLQWSDRARELDPLGIIGTTKAWILFQSRRNDESIRQLQSELRIRPDDATVSWFLAFALIANGQPKDAIPVLDKVMALSNGSSAAMGIQVRAYAHAGRRQEALKILDELKNRQQKGYVPAAAFVNAYLGLDDKEQAFAWLERAYQEHSNILQYVKVHPFMDPLRDDPRFIDLVRRVGVN